MNLNLTGANGSVEVSDLAFGKEFNEALVHRLSLPIWQLAVRVPKRRKIVQLYPAVVPSPSVRRNWPCPCRYQPLAAVALGWCYLRCAAA